MRAVCWRGTLKYVLYMGSSTILKHSSISETATLKESAHVSLRPMSLLSQIFFMFQGLSNTKGEEASTPLLRSHVKHLFELFSSLTYNLSCPGPVMVKNSMKTLTQSWMKNGEWVYFALLGCIFFWNYYPIFLPFSPDTANPWSFLWYYSTSSEAAIVLKKMLSGTV